MKVLKFGGGCLKDVDAIKKLPNILQLYDNKIIIVISAFGKLTNLLERIYSSKTKDFKSVLSFFKDLMAHLQFSDESINVIIEYIIDLYSSNKLTQAECLSIGELVSSKILSLYFNQINFKHILFNASMLIQTENNGINSPIDWEATLNKSKIYEKIFSDKNHFPVLTQGFISGSGNDKSVVSTCLGREGSDYSAAIFANIFNAEEVILFKDVNGIYSTDPKEDPSAEFFSELSYQKAYKICNNTNTVVHPKTINKLQEKQIPILIRNFNNLRISGTKIH